MGILTYLLQTDRATMPELAARFEVSRRTIQRDVDALCCAGIPLVSTRGSGGGVAIMDGYKLDRLLLSPGELQGILAGLRGLDLSLIHIYMYILSIFSIFVNSLLSYIYYTKGVERIQIPTQITAGGFDK